MFECPSNKTYGHKNVIIISTEFWQSPYHIGSHCIAEQFYRHGFRVGFFSAPLTSLHFAKWNGGHLCARLKSCLVPFEKNNFYARVPFALIAPDNRLILRSRFVLHHWWRLAVPSFRRILKNKEFLDVDVLYMDNFYQPFWPDLVKYKHFIFRIPDDHAGFTGVTPYMLELEQKLADRADLIICTSRNVMDRMRAQCASKMLLIPNGVELEHFRQKQQIPKEYTKLKGPKIIYTGAMDQRFDFELMLQIARQLPGINFILVGPISKGAQALTGMPNILLLGARPYEKIPAYLQHADAGIIPFNVCDFPQRVNAVNPLKLYQYMACDLPVVSVKWNEIARLQPPVALVEQNAKAFAEALHSVLDSGIDTSAYNLFLQNVSWEERLKPFFRFLGEKQSCTNA